MATSDEIPDKIGFTAKGDPLGPSNEGTLGPRPNGPDKLHPTARATTEAVIASDNKARATTKAADKPSDPMADIAELKASIARLEGLFINPGQGHTAIVNKGKARMTIDLNLIPPDPQMSGGVGTGNSSTYYGPSGVTNWATPGQPLDTEVEAALLAMYTGIPATPTKGDVIELWPTSAGYLSVICICMGIHSSSPITRFIHITISAVQYDFMVTGATST